MAENDFCRVFVYGTLKRGYGNHGLLAQARFLGEFRTDPEFTLVDLGAFPGLLLGGDTPVKGEVYEVDSETLKRLDRLEGYPNFYDRFKMDSPFGELWAYVLDDSYRRHTKLHNGVWEGRAI